MIFIKILIFNVINLGWTRDVRGESDKRSPAKRDGDKRDGDKRAIIARLSSLVPRKNMIYATL